jgi:SAM-dependent methyltransferase
MPTTCIVDLNEERIVSAPTNYQGFEYGLDSGVCIPTNNRTKKKWKAVEIFFPELVRGRSFLDLGANFGFFCYKAMEQGASHATAVESNKQYFSAISRAQDLERRVAWLHAKFPQGTSHLEADVVWCMSLIHHVFPKKSMEEILDALREMTHVAAVVEWVGRDDRAVRRKGWARQYPEWNEQNFRTLAEERFVRVFYIGEGHHPERALYVLTVVK